MSPYCVGFKMKFFAVNVSLVKTNVPWFAPGSWRCKVRGSFLMFDYCVRRARSLTIRRSDRAAWQGVLPW